MNIAKNVICKLWRATFIVGYGQTKHRTFPAESIVSATYIAEEYAKDNGIDLASVVEEKADEQE